MKLPECKNCKIWLPAIALLAVGFYTAWLFVPPSASSALVIATGSKTGAYYRFAQEYQAGFKAENIDLQIQTTAGSVEALQLLQDKKVDLAFVQGGIVSEVIDQELYSIASLFYEPLWVFQRKDVNTGNNLKNLRGKTIAVGTKGSGHQALALQLLQDMGISADNTTLLETSDVDVINRRFGNGELDAAFFVASPQSPDIINMLSNTNLQVMDFSRHALAYASRYPFISHITVGEGMISLEQNIPDKESKSLTTTATMLASNTVHPDHISLLAREALRIHGRAGVFESTKEFPSMEYLELPVHPDARKYFEKGPSFLEKYLPFSAATRLDQFKIMLIPMLTLLFPMIRGIFPLYQWRIRSRTYRWYKDLNEIDRRLDSLDLAGTEQEITNLRELHRELAREVSVPLSYMSEFYALRIHTDHILNRLRERKARLLDQV